MTNAQMIVKALGGDWHGSYGLCPAPAHSPKDRSLKVWDGEDGEPKLHSFAGDDWRDIRDDLAARGLIESYSSKTPGYKKPLGAPSYQTPSGQDPETLRKIALTQKIWFGSGLIDQSIAETYLCNRGLRPPFSPSLRCHSSLHHTATNLMLPALVAAVTRWPSKKVQAIHRTFLRHNGKEQATACNAKMALGPCRGGAVRLAPLNSENLIVGEGIETVLTVIQATGLPGWACLGTSGLKAVIVPPPDQQRAIIIAADHDVNGAGQDAAKALAERLTIIGHLVKIIVPDRPGTDFNDILRTEQANAA